MTRAEEGGLFQGWRLEEMCLHREQRPTSWPGASALESLPQRHLSQARGLDLHV